MRRGFHVLEHRRHHGNIGQVRAAIVGCIQRKHVAGTDVALVEADDGFHGAVHGPQMHRHVRRIGDKRAGTVEDGAGKIQPLLDVDRIGGVLERHAHLLGNRHEQIVEDLQHHRIGFSSKGRLALLLLHPA